MALNYHPKVGEILLCDFQPGFKVPEMVKTRRPVIVVSPALSGRRELVTVVPTSCIEPEVVKDYHCLIDKIHLPQLDRFQNKETWVKGDMTYTVGFHRLNKIMLGKKGANNKRLYFDQRLSREQMKVIYSCVLHGIGLSSLAMHL